MANRTIDLNPTLRRAQDSSSSASKTSDWSEIYKLEAELNVARMRAYAAVFNKPESDGSAVKIYADLATKLAKLRKKNEQKAALAGLPNGAIAPTQR